jgi:DNA mismatch repair protein MSH4
MIEEMIDTTLNEHVTYQSKPLDLRNQRIYCVKVGILELDQISMR